MELNDITEIFRKKEGKPTKINSQEAIDILGYLMGEDVRKIDARYKLYPDFKYHVFDYEEKPFEELMSVIKKHIYDGTENVRYDGKKCTINLEGPPEKVFFGICTCREKMEIIIGKKLIDDD